MALRFNIHKRVRQEEDNMYARVALTRARERDFASVSDTKKKFQEEKKICRTTCKRSGRRGSKLIHNVNDLLERDEMQKKR